MAEQDATVAPEQAEPITVDNGQDPGEAKSTVPTDGAVAAADEEDDDTIDDLEFLIDDIEDQIAPLGL
jgi:hypothetical protein